MELQWAYERLCDLSTPPKSWLVTKGTGIMRWAAAGVPYNGTNFCINKNRDGSLEVDYHVQLPYYKIRREMNYSRNHTVWTDTRNYCSIRDARIKICVPFCSMDVQKQVVKAVLLTGDAATVAKLVEMTTNLHGWAIVVLEVNFLDPAARLHISSFDDQRVFCSIYVGIDPWIGFGYLFEVQLVKVIPSDL
ncbi:hypothetical protein Q1695_004732 [Nippostrongylus brasiliensis]|nr:hypothetical protein Q1695_004732 [Nippostrongylus brasiliensis]